MELKRCPNGHFYDGEKFAACPHCGGSAGGNETIAFTPGGAPDDLEDKTVSGEYVASKGGDMGAGKPEEPKRAPERPTDGCFGVPREDPAQPVVGWLVCTKGRHMGRDFRLVAGRNFIGRSGSMNVALEGENSVSRENHAIVAYEPRQSLFIAQPGSASELFYLNGEVVLNPVLLKANDRLQLGEAELMLIPCCDEKFKWETKKQ